MSLTPWQRALCNLRTIPEDRWVLETSAQAMSKGEAWYRVSKAGYSLGIPHHAWRKAHVYDPEAREWSVWRWYTECPGNIDYMSKLYGFWPGLPHADPSVTGRP